MVDRTDDRQISETAPPYSLVTVWRTIKDKGLLKALDDPEQGPHVHLTLLLGTILVVSFVIIAITKFMLSP